jgi:hypothetical protein
MGKKGKDKIIDDYQKLRNEMIIDRVNEIFRSQPENYIAALKELGFEYYEDEDEEEIEEKKAKPENRNQIDLVAYFEGKRDLSEAILTAFLAEREAEEPNLPLIRKYFKQANQNLKALILYGLDKHSTSIDLLSDLAFFHEFENSLRLLITHYTRACTEEMDLQAFSELAQDFYFATNPDGYEALDALRDLFESHKEKRKVIDFLISEAKISKKAIEF